MTNYTISPLNFNSLTYFTSQLSFFPITYINFYFGPISHLIKQHLFYLTHDWTTCHGEYFNDAGERVNVENSADVVKSEPINQKRKRIQEAMSMAAIEEISLRKVQFHKRSLQITMPNTHLEAFLNINLIYFLHSN